MEPNCARRRLFRGTGGFPPLAILASLASALLLSPTRPLGAVTPPPSLSLVLDSDLDGMPDGLEVEYGTDPMNPDTDGDGFLDLEEFVRKSNPSTSSVTPTGSASAVRVFLFAPDLGSTRTLNLGAAIYLPAGALSQPGSFTIGFPSYDSFTAILDTALVASEVSLSPGLAAGSLTILFSFPVTLPAGVSSFPPLNLAAGGMIGGTLAKDTIYVDELGGIPGTYEILAASTGGGPASAAFRPINPASVPAGATFGEGCVLTMQSGGSSNGYVVVEVTDADCQPFPGYCDAGGCAEKLGSAHLIYDLLGVVGG